MSVLNVMKCDCDRIFVRYLHLGYIPKTISYLSYEYRVNNIICKHDQDNTVNCGKFHMSSKQICICLTHSVYSLHKVWQLMCFCENEATADYHHGSALKLRNTCHRSKTQRLVSWSKPVVRKVWVETQTTVAARGEIGREGCEISSLVAGLSPRFSSRGCQKPDGGAKNQKGGHIF